ncbi:MAG: CopD family protein [Bdellovibrio sp.]|nr:CopD family protein [Bdellovibrio sp.]
MYGILIFLHLIGASIWVGGHLILAIGILPKALKANDPSIIQDFEAVFENIGIPALITQVITGLSLAYLMLGNDLIGLTSGPQRTVTLKLAGLLFTLILALHARLGIIPQLTKENLRLLSLHIYLVTFMAIGLIFLGVNFRQAWF